MFDIFPLFPHFSYTDDRNRGVSFYSPLSDVSKSENAYTISVELPGVSRSDIDVSVDGNSLIVSAKRDSIASSPQKNYRKSWTLGEKTLVDEISAKYESGILFIEVPIKVSKKRKIDIN